MPMSKFDWFCFGVGCGLLLAILLVEIVERVINPWLSR